MPSDVLVKAGLIELFPDHRQLTLWSSCSTTIAFSWASHSANRVETTELLDGFSNGHSCR